MIIIRISNSVCEGVCTYLHSNLAAKVQGYDQDFTLPTHTLVQLTRVPGG